MGILSRFKDIMAANINALLDKAEDPEKMIDQCLRNLNTDLAKVKSETAEVMAQEKAAKRDLDACESEIAKMNNYAIKAVEAGNDDDARKFLVEKTKLTSKQAGLQQNYNLAHDNAEKMRQMHDKLTNDIRELEDRKATVKGKLAVAKTQEKINKMTADVSGTNDTIASFERLEKAADAKLDKAMSMAELNSTKAGSEIKDLSYKYENNPDVDSELAALKASLGQTETAEQ